MVISFFLSTFASRNNKIITTMLNINKGKKVFFLYIRGNKVEKAEWTTVTLTYVDSTSWTCETVIDLENGYSVFDGVHKRSQSRLSDNVLMNQIVKGCFFFIGTTKKECIDLAGKFLDNEINALRNDIKEIEKGISDINEVKNSILSV